MHARFSTLLAAVGAIHVAVATFAYSDAVTTVIDDGVWNAVPDRAGDPDATFWYLFAGFGLAVLAALVHRLERRGGRLGAVGVILVTVGAFGQVLKPTSPLCAIALIGIVALAVARSRRLRRPIVGRLLGALAAGHTLAVAAFYGDGLRRILDDGIVGAVEPSSAVPDAAFWYMLSGLTVLTLSVVVRWCERDDPWALLPIGWSVVGLAVCGIVVMPVSGFWILLAAGLAGVMIGRRARAEAHPRPGASPVQPMGMPVPPMEVPVPSREMPDGPTEIPVQPMGMPVEPMEMPVEPMGMPVEPMEMPVRPMETEVTR